MVKHIVLGEEIWECTEEEIRALWAKTAPDDRHRFWENSEVTKHYHDTPAQVAECLARKMASPGRI